MCSVVSCKVECNMDFLGLNDDCLLEIISYCDAYSVINLTYCAYRLKCLIDKFVYPRRTMDLLMCGRRDGPAITARTTTVRFNEDRLRISENWKRGRYIHKTYSPEDVYYRSKLHLQHDFLYMSYKKYVRVFKRKGAEALEGTFMREMCGNNSYIADFVKKDDTMFAGSLSGKCFIQEGIAEQPQIFSLHNRRDKLSCIDFAGYIYATGTERTLKIYQRSEIDDEINLDVLKTFTNAYTKIHFNFLGDHLFCGLGASMDGLGHLRDIDMESGTEFILNSTVTKTMDIKDQSNQTFFTANYDGTIRLYNRRSNCDELIWSDFLGSPFNCMEYDGLHAILSGCERSTRVNLYDMRNTDEHIQFYYTKPEPIATYAHLPPVYDIACDSRYLFAVSDGSIEVLDFKYYRT